MKRKGTPVNEVVSGMPALECQDITAVSRSDVGPLTGVLITCTLAGRECGLLFERKEELQDIIDALESARDAVWPEN